MSGQQRSEQSPNQGTVPQSNSNSQMQNLVAASGAGAGASVVPSLSIVRPMDSDILKLRQYMQVRVLNVLQKRLPSQADDATKAKYMDVARRLEEGLFKMAISKEEYANESTLESRLASLIKGRRLKNYNQRLTNSSMVGTMVPTTTTGLSHAGGSNPSSMVTPSAYASVGLGPSHNTVVPMDHDILKVREYMRGLVFSELHKRQPCPADDASKAKYLDVARRLEEALFQMAITKEDYLDPSTLTSRLATLIRGMQLNNQQNANSSPPGSMTTLPPEVSPETTMVHDHNVSYVWSQQVREKVPESEDELETEIAENLKSMTLNGWI